MRTQDINTVRHRFEKVLTVTQNDIKTILSKHETGAEIRTDNWTINELGYGKTLNITDGCVVEKCGVGISHISTTLTQELQKVLKCDDSDARLYASGISVIVHPRNPFAPSFHANSRLIIIYDKNEEVKDCWFGGGLDLTPYYLFEEDAIFFHKSIKSVCDEYKPDFYAHYKEKCDKYFYIKHRQECRGIGGIFFDRIIDNNIEDTLSFVTSLTSSYMNVYSEILTKRCNMPYSTKDREWQNVRRGRYVEFNLCYDRGTMFGLKTNGRIESILISMPPIAHWHYCHQHDSEHDKLLSVLRKPIDWANLK